MAIVCRYGNEGVAGVAPLARPVSQTVVVTQGQVLAVAAFAHVRRELVIFLAETCGTLQNSRRQVRTHQAGLHVLDQRGVRRAFIARAVLSADVARPAVEPHHILTKLTAEGLGKRLRARLAADVATLEGDGDGVHPSVQLLAVRT